MSQYPHHLPSGEHPDDEPEAPGPLRQHSWLRWVGLITLIIILLTIFALYRYNQAEHKSKQHVCEVVNGPAWCHEHEPWLYW